MRKQHHVTIAGAIHRAIHSAHRLFQSSSKATSISSLYQDFLNLQFLRDLVSTTAVLSRDKALFSPRTQPLFIVWTIAALVLLTTVEEVIQMRSLSIILLVFAVLALLVGIASGAGGAGASNAASPGTTFVAYMVAK